MPRLLDDGRLPQEEIMVTATHVFSVLARGLRCPGFVQPRPLLSLFLSLAFCAPADILSARTAGAVPPIQAGVYETLLLAVDNNGQITGYYREAQGEGAIKTCDFFLKGRFAKDVLLINTWNDQTFPGEMRSGDKAVTLKVPKASEHPGCGLMLLPMIATDGVELSQTLVRPWIELRTVAVTRSSLHSAPSLGNRRRAYLVQGDVVGVLAARNGWLQIEYLREGKSTTGWIPAGDAAVLYPP